MTWYGVTGNGMPANSPSSRHAIAIVTPVAARRLTRAASRSAPMPDSTASPSTASSMKREDRRMKLNPGNA